MSVSPIDPAAGVARAETARRLRLLFLLPFAPRGDAGHGGRAIVPLIAMLAERHDVGVLYLRRPDEPAADRSLTRSCSLLEAVHHEPPIGTRRRIRVALALANGRPLEALDSASPTFAVRAREVAEEWRPDIVQVELQRFGPYIASVAHVAGAVVLVAHDADAASAREAIAAARGGAKLFRLLDAQAWRRFQRRTLALADAVVAFTDRDRDLLASDAGRDLVTIPLRPGVPPRALDAGGTDPPTVLFVGGFGHLPNVDAARRLAERIFPRVRAEAPRARLQIVGDRPPAEISRLAGPAIEVTGRVPQVTPYLDAAAVVAAPIAIGGGTRVKVLDALGAGKALVASGRAVEGLGIVAGEHALVAERDEELAAAIATLLRDPQTRRKLGAAARSWAEDNLDPALSVAAFERLYDGVLARTK